jgi:hypothetical protein
MLSIMTAVRMRATTSADAADLAALILLSAKHFLPAVFGPRIGEGLAALASRRGTLFSSSNAAMATVEGQTAGMLLGYSASGKARMDPATGLGLFRFLGPGVLQRLPRLLRVNRVIGMFGGDEWYVSNVAATPSFTLDGRAFAFVRMRKDLSA